MGQAHAKTQLYREEDARADADPVVFAQIRTDGVWNTEPGGAHNLLRFMKKTLNVKANYLTRTVKLDTDPLADYSFLYLSGLSDFTLNPAEAFALRGYLTSGGYLLIDNSLGLEEFHQAVSREMKKVLPDSAFARLPPGHAVFLQGPFKLDAVRYTLAARARHPTLTTPLIEVLNVDGQARVLYSPFDLAAGWQGEEHPLSYGYETADALRLGANLITYCLTH